MKFVFCDKSDLETNIITNVLQTEKIPYKVKSKKVHCYFFDEEEDEDNECMVRVANVYDIFVNTDLEHYDFVKTIAENEIRKIVKLEICYMKQARRRYVQRVHKKSIANTNNRDKSE